MARVELLWRVFQRHLALGLLLVGAAFCLTLFRSTRALALIPLLSLRPIYTNFKSETARIEATPILFEHFAESLPALDRFADGVTCGDACTVPAAVGHFSIKRYERIGEAIALYTQLGGLGRPDGRWGFIRAPGVSINQPSLIGLGCEPEIATKHSLQHFRGDWFIIFDSYTYFKRGPS